MTHRPHPISERWDGHVYDDPEDAILFDRCDGCKRHAEEGSLGLTLDAEKFRRAWDRMVEVEFGKGAWANANPGVRVRRDYRTFTERDLCRQLYRVWVLIERRRPGEDPTTLLFPPSIEEQMEMAANVVARFRALGGEVG